MIRFFINLFKLLFRKKKREETDNIIPFNKDIKWIRPDLGVEKRGNKVIIHAIDSELSPQEIIEIVQKEMNSEE